MSKLKSMGHYTLRAYFNRFFSTRTLILVILYAFVLHIFLSPVKSFTSAVQHRTSPWYFPFMLSNVYFLLLVSTGAIYFFSNVPFMNDLEMYYLIRTGRLRWGISQIFYIILSSFSIISILMLLSLLILMPDINLSFEWGKVIHTLSLTDAGTQFKMLFSVDYYTQNLYSPLQLYVITFLIGGLGISFIGLIMFTISLYFSRIAAIGTVMIFAVLPPIVENSHLIYQQFFSYLSPLSWMRIVRIGRSNFGYTGIPPLSQILLLFLLIIMVCILFIILKVRKCDFFWNKEA